jgi:hypothetical protein
MDMNIQSRIPPTIYDEGQRPWQQNINDLVDYKRAFQAGDGEIKREAQAMISQNPALPREELKQNMTTHKFPPRFGYPQDELTINQVLAGSYQQDVEMTMDEWNNFSGSNGEINSTARPNGMWW